MSIDDELGNFQSSTDPEKALSLFTDRHKIIRLFSSYINDMPKKTILYIYSEGGNGKSLLINYLKTYCCKFLNFDDWKSINSLSDEDFITKYKNSKSIQETPTVLIDFGMQSFADERPQEVFSALLMIKRRLSSCGISFPIFDFACICYLDKTGQLTKDKLRSILPSEELDLLSSFMDSVSKSTKGAITKPILSLANKYLGFNVSKIFTLFMEKRKLSKEQAEKIQLMDDLELINNLPILFAEDLNTHMTLAAKAQRLVLFFDTYEAFWGNQHNLSDELFFQKDEWFRKLLRKLELKSGIVVVVAGREQPRWSQVAHQTNIPNDYIDSHLLDYFEEPDADTYLTKAGIKEQRLRQRIITYSSITTNKIHPFLLGLCVDLFEEANAKGQKIEPNSFVTISTEANKPQVLINRLLKYLDNELNYAIQALSACRTFNFEIYIDLGKALSYSVSKPTFDKIKQFSFVWQVDEPQGRFRIHELIRRLNHENNNDIALRSHSFLEKYYKEKGMIAEAIYHVNQQEWLRGVQEWVEVFERELLMSHYEQCRILLEVRSYLRFGDDFSVGCVLAAEGNYFKNTSSYKEAEAAYVKAIDAYNNSFKANPQYPESLVNKGVVQNNLADLYKTLSKYNEAITLFKETIETYDQVLQFNTYKHAYFNNKGLALQGIGQINSTLSTSNEALSYYEQALESYNQALELSPTLMEAHSNKGYVYLSLANINVNLSNTEKAFEYFSSSIAAYDMAINLAPDRPDLLSNKGSALLDIGELQLVLSEYNKAFQSFKDAEKLFDTAIQLAPNYISLHHNKGKTLSNIAQLQSYSSEYEEAFIHFNKAIDSYNNALEFSPKAINVLNSKSLALKKQGDLYLELQESQQAQEKYEEAIAIYRQILSLVPNDIDINANRASIYSSLSELNSLLSNFSEATKNCEDAIEVYDQVISLAPNSSNLLNKKGLVLKNLVCLLIEQSRYDQAILFSKKAEEIYKQALSIAPTSLEVQYNLGSLYSHIGKIFEIKSIYDQAIYYFDQSIALFEKALTISPNFPKLHSDKAILLFNKGNLHKTLGNYDEAKETYNLGKQVCEYTLNIAPKYVPALNAKGVILCCITEVEIKLSNPQEALLICEEAIELYSEILSTFPSHLTAHLNKANNLSLLGKLLIELGVESKNFTLLERAKTSFNNAVAHFNLVLTASYKDKDAYINKGNCLLSFAELNCKLQEDKEAFNNFQGAFLQFDKAVELAPQFSTVYNNKGAALAIMADYQVKISKYPEALITYTKALNIFEEAFKHAPNCLVTSKNKATLLQKVGHLYMLIAQSTLISSLSLQNQSGAKTVLLEVIQSYEKAVIAINEALAINPNLEEALIYRAISHINLANFYSQIGQTENISTYYQRVSNDLSKVLEINPNNSEANLIYNQMKISN